MQQQHQEQHIMLAACCAAGAIIYTYVCMYMCIYIHIYIYVYIHIHIQTYIHTHVHRRLHKKLAVQFYPDLLAQHVAKRAFENSIVFHGRVLEGKGRACVCSWPGKYAPAWDAMVRSSKSEKSGVVFCLCDGECVPASISKGSGPGFGVMR